MGAYTYAENIKDVLIADLDQFEYDDSGANVGVGYSGWDSALSYARANNLDYFGSIFPAMGDDQAPDAFQYKLWQWVYYVRLHVKFDVDADPTSDELAATLADDAFDALIKSTNIQAIAPGGMVKVTAINYMSDPELINDVTYLTLEFMVAVKVQIARA